MLLFKFMTTKRKRRGKLVFEHNKLKSVFITLKLCFPQDMNYHNSLSFLLLFVSFLKKFLSKFVLFDFLHFDRRVIFGPELVMLGPDEQFTQLSLSGGKPKKPNMIKSLCLLLGPDFCTDIIVVETADHARLSLQLSYNW